MFTLGNEYSNHSFGWSTPAPEKNAWSPGGVSAWLSGATAASSPALSPLAEVLVGVELLDVIAEPRQTRLYAEFQFRFSAVRGSWFTVVVMTTTGMVAMSASAAITTNMA